MSPKTPTGAVGGGPLDCVETLQDGADNLLHYDAEELKPLLSTGPSQVLTLPRIKASPLRTLLSSFAKGSPWRGPGVIRGLSTNN